MASKAAHTPADERQGRHCCLCTHALCGPKWAQNKGWLMPAGKGFVFMRVCHSCELREEFWRLRFLYFQDHLP